MCYSKKNFLHLLWSYHDIYTLAVLTLWCNWLPRTEQRYFFFFSEQVSTENIWKRNSLISLTDSGSLGVKFAEIYWKFKTE